MADFYADLLNHYKIFELYRLYTVVEIKHKSTIITCETCNDINLKLITLEDCLIHLLQKMDI